MQDNSHVKFQLSIIGCPQMQQVCYFGHIDHDVLQFKNSEKKQKIMTGKGNVIKDDGSKDNAS